MGRKTACLCPVCGALARGHIKCPNGDVSGAEQGRLDAIYAIFLSIEQESRNEQDAWTSLDTIEQLHGPIDAGTRFALLRALQQARGTDENFRIAGYYALFHAQKLGIASNPETSPRQGDVHSICLALSTSPEQAQKLLQTRLPH